MARIFCRVAMMRKGFYMIYAVFLIVSVGIICTFYMRNSFNLSHSQSNIHAKIQLNLYTQSLKSMIIMCLQQRDLPTCDYQEFLFAPHYHFSTALTPLDAQNILLDISGEVTHPSSTNKLRITRRYILLQPHASREIL